MERVTFLVEGTHERVTALLNPESVVMHRLAPLRERINVAGEPNGVSDWVVGGGGVTEIELDLVFDVSLAGSSVASDDVRQLTGPLWRLSEASLRRGIATLPRVRLIWGKAWNLPAHVVALAERLEHFDGKGAARRSWLRMRLRRVPEAHLSAATLATKRGEPASGVSKPLPRPKDHVRTPLDAQKPDLVTVGSGEDAVARAFDEPESRSLMDDAGQSLRRAQETIDSLSTAESNEGFPERAPSAHQQERAGNELAEGSTRGVENATLIDTSIVPDRRSLLEQAKARIAQSHEQLHLLPAAANRGGLLAVRRTAWALKRTTYWAETAARNAPESLRPAFVQIAEMARRSWRRVVELGHRVSHRVRQSAITGYRVLRARAEAIFKEFRNRLLSLLERAGELGAADWQRVSVAVLRANEALGGVLSALGSEAFSAIRTVAPAAAANSSTLEAFSQQLRCGLAEAWRLAMLALAELRHACGVGGCRLPSEMDRSVARLGDAVWATLGALGHGIEWVAEGASVAVQRAVIDLRQWPASTNPKTSRSMILQELEMAACGGEGAPSGVVSWDELSEVSLLMSDGSSDEESAEAIERLLDLTTRGTLESIEGLVTDLAVNPFPIHTDGILRLDQLAWLEYGDPRHWRTLAQHNGIDDPLRVPRTMPIQFPPHADVAFLGQTPGDMP